MTTSTSLQVNIQPERVELRLGEPVSFEVQVFNGSPIVDEFAVELLGPIYDPLQPEWITSVPATLPLFPDESGAVTITVLAPAGSLLAAGAHRLGVRVSSTTERQRAVVREIALAVASQPALYMLLEPEHATGGRTANLHVQVRNIGNTPLHLVLGADDPANALTFAFQERELELPVDTERFIPLELAGTRPIIGRAAQHPFSVSATITDRSDEIGVEPVLFGEPARANGMFVQRPWINRNVISVFAALIPVLAILAAAFILRPATEPLDISGDLAFGVDGEVDTVYARENAVVLFKDPLAKLSEDTARLELGAYQVALRSAVVAAEAIEIQQLIDQATAAKADQSSAGFLAALDEKLESAQLDALALNGSALTGLIGAFTAYCGALATPLPECANPNYPLTEETVAALTADASSLAASVVLDANEKYTQVTITQQNLQGLRDDVKAEIEATSGDATDEDEDAAGDEELQELLARQAEVSSEQTAAELAQAEQAVAEAAVACRDAITAVALTMLRAPFDARVDGVFATRGAEVKADDPAFRIERTDGRAFEATAAQRQPLPSDIPDDLANTDEVCPETFAGWQAFDADAGAAPAAEPPPDK